MSTPSINKSNDPRSLTKQDLGSWSNLEHVPNSAAQSTTEKLLSLYERYQQVYHRDEAPKEYDRFKRSVGELQEMYGNFNRDKVLDRGERAQLRAAANKTDLQLVDLIERADLPRAAQALAGPGASESAKAASPDKATPPAPENIKAQAFPAGGPSEAKRSSGFDGRYQNVADKALDEVTSGKTTLGVGTRGPAVREAQELMQKHGASFTKTDASGEVVKDYGADGFMGDVTKRELEKLQKQWGLPATGALDAKTMEKLREAPKKEEVSSSAKSNAAESELQRVTRREAQKFGQGLEKPFQSLPSQSGSNEGPRHFPEAAADPELESSGARRSGRNKPTIEPQPQDLPLSPAPTPQTYLA